MHRSFWCSAYLRLTVQKKARKGAPCQRRAKTRAFCKRGFSLPLLTAANLALIDPSCKRGHVDYADSDDILSVRLPVSKGWNSWPSSV
ncbi:hypothetical protein BCR39DRAFT_554096 [Naematelia encephala]|uniref:Uncharacterized protein n=1 Tax=Naematelia encephala TaxID=71784 RepID=A0A1Y2AGY8_9TREE|nr:hypothetical protein BCR39DRAFT_554096 [Naematelia encephala]